MDPGAFIASLQLVECRMAHERAVSVESGADGAEPDIRRRPLCGAAARASRLACGHTSARNNAVRALDALEASGALPPGQARVLGDELTRIGDAIHALDHRKGDAEKRAALEPSAAARAAVAALEAEHAVHVAELRGWKARALKGIL